MLSRVAVALFALASLAASTAPAAFTVGPFLDFKDPIDPPTSLPIGISISTPGSTVYYDPYVNRIIHDRIDRWEWHLIYASLPHHDVIGLAYATYPGSGFTGDVEITTIYGLDPNPTSLSSLAITGFDPADTTLVAGDETIFGISGTPYAAHSRSTPTVGELSTLHPDFDLSPFQGSAANYLYVFQTTVPFAELPEPASVSLLAIGTTVLLTRRRR